MQRICLFLLAGVFSTGAIAGAKCVAHPKAEWMKEADARARIEAQGYTIKKFKVDGNCYEIYGTTKEGKKAEIYYDTKTLDVVKSEIEK
ncbi:PepSY domain-containing protein [Cupriavidus basilensis]|uniref:PepSY domain-containing protein n=1 Tax=Cupriavidus TaxID=106589 RepID=UPI0023E8140B|nr:PepSY domain-containing protein [Cupriavidus basilensis]MDF3885119.1 PepSY domain-containing protein [Cupriavidus basilensis]